MLSPGAIVALVLVVILLAVLVVVFMLRRRRYSRRDHQAHFWWFSRRPTSQSYNDNTNEPLAGTASHRSSFATNIDHSSPLSATLIPASPPPMAEVGRPNGTAPALILDIQQEPARFSIGSAHSDNSQYLVIRHRNSIEPSSATPLSGVSFAQDTQAYSFPKPPTIGDRNSGFSGSGPPTRPSSSHSKASARGTISPINNVFNLPPTPAIPPGITDSPVESSSTPTDPFADESANPFQDSGSPPPAQRWKFNSIENVFRPFVPQLQDELRVDVGDTVRIIQTFDDGWALAELQGSGGGSALRQGLLPLDCLRRPGQSLPSFFESKRRSSSSTVDHSS